MLNEASQSQHEISSRHSLYSPLQSGHPFKLYNHGIHTRYPKKKILARKHIA